MMKRSARRSPRDDNRMLVVGIVVVIALFCGAYSYGRGASAKIAVDKTATLRRQEAKLLEEQAECTRKMRERSSFSAEELRLQDETAALEGEKNSHLENRERYEDLLAECANKLEKLNEDKETDAQIPDADVVQAQERLTAEIARNAGNSSRVVLLFEILRMLMIDHEKLMKLYDPSRDPPKVRTKAYQNEIVRKWAELDKDIAKEARENPTESKFMSLEKFAQKRDEDRLANMRASHRLDAYDLDPHATSILWLEKVSGSWPKPQWKGITQNRKREGVLQESIIPTSDVNIHIRKTLNFLTCSAALNISSLMSTNEFKVDDGAPVELLSNYVDTPVFAFCTHCAPIQRTDAFDYLCSGYKAWDTYGSEMYWRVRSRMKYKDTILSDAEDYIEFQLGSKVNKKELAQEYETDPQDMPYILAVVIPKPLLEEEEHKSKPSVLYQKVLKDVNVHEISTEEEQQRTVSFELLADTVGKKVSELRAAGKNVKVFISALHFTYENWQQLLERKKMKNLQDLNLVYSRRDLPYTSARDLVDTMIAAWSDEIIIGRYDMKSMQVGENYLLSNRLNTSKINVW